MLTLKIKKTPQSIGLLLGNYVLPHRWHAILCQGRAQKLWERLHPKNSSTLKAHFYIRLKIPIFLKGKYTLWSLKPTGIKNRVCNIYPKFKLEKDPKHISMFQMKSIDGFGLALDFE